ncbi:hypothetical protein HpCOL240_01180 [Helicobacter pylori]
MHNHTIYLRKNTLYLNYTKNSKRHRTSLNKLTKILNLENDKALEYLKGLSLEKILKMQKGALKPNKEPKQESQRTAKKTKRTTIAQAKESFFNQKIGLKAERLQDALMLENQNIQNELKIQNEIAYNEKRKQLIADGQLEDESFKQFKFKVI